MESTMQLTNFSGLKKLVFVFVISSVILLVIFVALNQHAIDRHGSIASRGSNCFDSHGSMLHMYNPVSKRNADICLDDIYYVYITTESGEPVTMIGKEKMSHIEQVIQWLKNTGYTQ